MGRVEEFLVPSFWLRDVTREGSACTTTNEEQRTNNSSPKVRVSVNEHNRDTRFPLIKEGTD